MKSQIGCSKIHHLAHIPPHRRFRLLTLCASNAMGPAAHVRDLEGPDDGTVAIMDVAQLSPCDSVHVSVGTLKQHDTTIQWY